MAWGKKLSPAARKFIHQMGLDFGRPADEFTACMAFETMETFSPSIRPRRKDGSLVSTAVGLIQFLDSTAKALGTSTEQLEKMTVEEQLPWVWRYFQKFLKASGKTLESLEDVYMVIHWPAAVGAPLDHPMYVEGSAAFAANGGLDLNHDKIITKGEAGSLVRAKLAKGLQPEWLA